MKLRWMVLLGLVLAGQLLVAARADTPADVEKRLRRDLQFLTSDDCEGRGFNTKGINVAADYIAREFERAGLRPAAGGKSFFQPFELTVSAKAGPNNRLALRGPLGQTITLQRDGQFAVPFTAGNGKTDAEVVFAGYGLVSEKPKYDDYAGIDVKGKVVVVLSGSPREDAGEFTGPTERRGVPFSPESKVAEARKRGAVAVVVVNGPRAARLAGRDSLPARGRFGPMRASPPVALPLVHLKRDWLDRMLISSLGRSLAEVEKGIDIDLKPASIPLKGWTCQLETDITRLTVKNIVGVLEGSGPLANQTIVVGAHYDHIGLGSSRGLANRPAAPGGAANPPTRVAGPGAPGGVGFPIGAGGGSAVHHGADDNASGTVAVMELARRFGAMKGREGRRLVFITFTAEEIGLIGSAHYCREPLFPLADTVTMINMDMVGRLQDDKVLVSGVGTAKLFPELVDRLKTRHRLELLKENAGNGPSDHSSFFSARVPVLNFFTGFHEQYHRPTDRHETINVPGLRRLADLVGDVMEELSRSSTRPEFVRATGSFDRTKTLWAMAPSIGLIPRYVDNRDGVLVENVLNQTAAARAGLKKGDRVIAAGGKPITDPTTFLNQSRVWKPGEKVELTVLRDGKEHKLPLQLVQAPSRGQAGRGTARLGFAPRPVEGKEGLYVTGIDKAGPAAQAGLQENDRLVAINKEPVNTTQDLFRASAGLRDAASAEVVVERAGKKLIVTLKLR